MRWRTDGGDRFSRSSTVRWIGATRDPRLKLEAVQPENCQRVVGQFAAQCKLLVVGFGDGQHCFSFGAFCRFLFARLERLNSSGGQNFAFADFNEGHGGKPLVSFGESS